MAKLTYQRSLTSDRPVLVNSEVSTVKAVSWLTGTTVVELAEESGLDRPHLQKVSKGDYPVTRYIAEALAKVTPRSCTAEFFLQQTVILKAFRNKRTRGNGK